MSQGGPGGQDMGGNGWGPPPGQAQGYGPPPGAFGPPPNLGMGGPSGPGFSPGVVTDRNSAVVLLLSIFTCGIYKLYWYYQTSDELRRALGDESINPTTDLLLLLVTCGLWGMYVEYRNVQKVHTFLAARQPGRNDPSQTVMILNVAALFVGVTGLVATYMSQEEYNQLARAAG